MQLEDGMGRPVAANVPAVRVALEGPTSTVGLVDDPNVWISLDEANDDVDINTFDVSTTRRRAEIVAAIRQFLVLARNTAALTVGR